MPSLWSIQLQLVFLSLSKTRTTLSCIQAEILAILNVTILSNCWQRLLFLIYFSIIIFIYHFLIHYRFVIIHVFIIYLLFIIYHTYSSLILYYLVINICTGRDCAGQDFSVSSSRIMDAQTDLAHHCNPAVTEKNRKQNHHIIITDIGCI